jgi:hypothetical protein
VAADDQVNRIPVVIERVHGVQETLARNAKYGVYALGEQGVN